MTMFSKKYSSVDIWLEEHPQDTPYRRRILRMHQLYQDASLAQLRGHPGAGEEPLYWTKPRKASPQVLSEFMRLAEKYAEIARCFDFDEKGRRIQWKRPPDEPQ